MLIKPEFQFFVLWCTYLVGARLRREVVRLAGVFGAELRRERAQRLLELLGPESERGREEEGGCGRVERQSPSRDV